MSDPGSTSQVRWEPNTLGLPTFPSQVPTVLRGLAQEIPDEVIEEQKPGNRGLMLAELQGILRHCEQEAADNPGDPRWDELRLRTLDRLAKLLRLYEPQGPRDREGDVDRVRMRETVAGDLAALELKIRGQ